MRATHGNLRFVLITSLLLSAPANGAGWTALFDGHSFSGWTTQNGEPVEEGAWEVTSGTIHLNTSQSRGGNLITDRDYGDFELLFEWKNSAGGNNGIKYRVKDFDGRVLGCEYQIIDDVRHKNLRSTQRTASLYDIYEPSAEELLKPIGEFNRGRIVVCGNRIEHWLNGHLVVDAAVGSPEWKERIGNSKFSDVEGFGQNRCGRIMLTDHNDEIWFRNIYVRSLPSGRRLASLSTTRARRFTCCQRVRPRATLRNVLCRR